MVRHEDSYYITRVLDGFTKDYAVLVDRHKEMVFTLVMRITKSREDAEEVAQDAFIKAFDGLHRFKGEARFSSWLYRIAYNEAISKVRKKSLQTVQLEEELTQDMTEEVVMNEVMGMNDREQKAVITKTLDDLDESEASLITLYYLEDNKVEEISYITGMSVSNVKVKLHRTRKKMYKIMNRIMHERVQTLN
jgi:RNA polymerase sigma-70 factor (ECF subfamily)